MATYNIPLRSEILKVPKHMRAQKATKAVKAYLIKHSKTTDVKLGKYLNLKLWEHGMKNPPKTVKVDTTKDDKGMVRAELFGAPKEVPKEEPKKDSKKTEAVKEPQTGLGSKVTEAKAEVKEAVVTKETPAAKKEVKEAVVAKETPKPFEKVPTAAELKAKKDAADRHKQ